MSQYIAINDAEAGHRIKRLASEGVYNPRSDTCIARYSNDKLMGGVIYENFTRGSVEMAVAGVHPSWLSRALLFVAFDYPFNQMGCRKVFSRISSRNVASQRLCRHLGFDFEASLSDVFLDGDLLIFSMYREDCRFLSLQFPPVAVKKELPDGQIVASAAP